MTRVRVCRRLCIDFVSNLLAQYASFVFGVNPVLQYVLSFIQLEKNRSESDLSDIVLCIFIVIVVM